jgi:tetratricopeptide (TPR) repeat protein
LTSDDSDKIWILTGIASIYSDKKEYDRALHFFREALQLAQITKTPASKIHHDMGVLFFEENRLYDATNEFQEALRVKDKEILLRDNPSYEISILWHLSSIAYGMRDYENMIIYLRKVSNLIDNNNYYYANTHLKLGHYYSWKGAYEKAREHYNQVLIAPKAGYEEVEMAKTCLSQLPLHD